MSLLDLFRDEYLEGRILDNYKLDNGNVGIILDDAHTRKKYHVEFKDGYSGPALRNFYGFLKNPFASKTQSLSKLLNKGNYVRLTTSYGRGPYREAYRIHTVYGPKNIPEKANSSYRPIRLLKY